MVSDESTDEARKSEIECGQNSTGRKILTIRDVETSLSRKLP